MAKKLTETFFIASLPRTRTAWLANLFTCGDSFCFHEVLKWAASPREMRRYFESTNKPYVGDSDSGLPFFMDELMVEFPKSRLVVVERDPEVVIKSLTRVFPETGVDFREIVEKTVAAITQMKAKYRVYTVPFENLSEQRVCRELWNYCLPKIPFDETRWKMLDVLTVEIQPQKYLKSISAEAAKRLDERVKNFTHVR